MQKSKKDLAREELEKIYDNKFKWVQAGNALRNSLGDSFDYWKYWNLAYFYFNKFLNFYDKK